MVDAPEKTFAQKLDDQLRNTVISAQKAIRWFQDNLKLLAATNANVLMARDRQRLLPTGSLQTKHIGRMIMFFYNPKYRETLPYFDRFPLVIIVKLVPGGFMGLNLHYLPIMYRQLIMTSLYTIYKTKHLDENKKLQLNYDMLNKASTGRYIKPCIKRYLYTGNDKRGGGVTSRFYVVDPVEWDKIIALPVERFEKKSAAQVQQESMQKMGIFK